MKGLLVTLVPVSCAVCAAVRLLLCSGTSPDLHNQQVPRTGLPFSWAAAFLPASMAHNYPALRVVPRLTQLR